MPRTSPLPGKTRSGGTNDRGDIRRMANPGAEGEGEMSNLVKKWTSEEDERLLDLKAEGLTLRHQVGKSNVRCAGEMPGFPAHSRVSWGAWPNAGMAGWGGRDRTSEWRNQNQAGR
jgi:hypothetical protein